MGKKVLMEKRTRREVMETMAALATGGALSSLGLPGAFAQTGHIPPGIHFGVQLNAFPIDPKRFQTFLDTLEEIKGIGYQGFESSYRNVSAQFDDPAPARRQIEQTGLTFFGIHIFFPNPGYDQATRIAAPSVYEPVARGGAALGAKHMILSGAPSVDREQLKRKIEALNTAGRFAQRAGIAAAYHNHWWEFRSKIGEIEALYAETDPALVSFVLDAGHAYHGGANVPEFIRAHSKRIVGMHLRDFKDGHYVELGQGTFPLAQVVATIRQIGWKGWVENEEEREDHSQTGMKVIAPAYKAMMEAFSS
jgi:inosose dehydratase